MSEKSSAFDKLHVEESEKNDLGGVLEQLNLPPRAVTFVRENKRLVQVCTAVVAIIVVSWALYDSYKDKRIEEASSSLALAVSKDDSGDKIEQLLAVSDNFSGTDSALWARVNAAHEMMKTERKQEGQQLYESLLSEINQNSGLYPLILAALAQAKEANADTSGALADYERIKNIKGYEAIGYMGLGRIHEEQGDRQQALSIYEEYLETLMNVNERSQKGLVEEKIARLKALL